MGVGSGVGVGLTVTAGVGAGVDVRGVLVTTGFPLGVGLGLAFGLGKSLIGGRDDASAGCVGEVVGVGALASEMGGRSGISVEAGVGVG